MHEDESLANHETKTYIINTPEALVYALANPNRNKFFVLIDWANTRNRISARNNVELCVKILTKLEQKFTITKLESLNKYLKTKAPIVIEFHLLEFIRSKIHPSTKIKYDSIFFGADIYLSRLTFRTLIAGRKAIRESLHWRNRIKKLKIKNLELPSLKMQLHKTAGSTITNITDSNLTRLNQELQFNNFFSEYIPDFENISGYIILGITDNELLEEKNQILILNCLRKLDLEKNCLILSKLHPNSKFIQPEVTNILESIAGSLNLQNRFITNLQELPLELLFYTGKLIHYIGLPSSALMTLPESKYTTLIPNKEKINVYKRAYLQAQI